MNVNQFGVGRVQGGQQTIITMRSLFLCVLVSSCSAFTPAGLRKPFSDSWIKEAEKKHSRVALLAVPSLVSIAAVTGDDPIQFLNNQPVTSQLVFYSVAGVLETLNLRRIDEGFKLKDGEEPGKLLPFEASSKLNSAEDWSGRVAMLIAAGFFGASIMG